MPNDSAALQSIIDELAQLIRVDEASVDAPAEGTAAHTRADTQAALLGLGFSKQQLDLIDSKKNNSRALRALLKHAATLIETGFSLEQIVKIAGNQSGAQALNAVFEHQDSLKTAGFSVEQITQIAAKKNNVKTIKKMAENQTVLGKLSGVG
ncbi:MAG: TAL effector repeat-containing protein [Burkholderiaceae bacterium]